MKKVLLSIGIAIVLMAQAGIASSALVFSDNFNAGSLNTFWWTPSAGTGNTVTHANNRIEMTQGSGAVGSDLNFNFLINGDFTADVEYSFLNWPVDNGERLGIRIDAGAVQGAVERVSDHDFGYESYLIDIGGNITHTPTGDTSGSLRLKREGTVFTGYYWSGSDWTTIHTYDSGSASDTNLALSIWPAVTPPTCHFGRQGCI